MKTPIIEAAFLFEFVWSYRNQPGVKYSVLLNSHCTINDAAPQEIGAVCEPHAMI